MSILFDEDELRRLLEERDRLREQVTELQTRCTVLLEEKRRACVDYGVREFHLKMGFPAPTELGVPPEDRVRFRMKIVTEEYLELLNAVFDAPVKRPWVLQRVKGHLAWIVDNADVAVDLVEWADATHDLDYVVAGTRVEFGYRGLAGAEEVHRSNMEKLSLRDGKKAIKPEGWKPPDIAGVLRAQGWRGQ